MPGSIGDLYGPQPKGGAAPKLPPSSAPASAPLLSLGTLKKDTLKGLSTLGDILSRPSEGVEALLSRGPGAGWHAFTHGEQPGKQEADRQAILNLAGRITGQPFAQEYQGSPGWLRTGINAVMDTGLDPTTYIGGAGLLEKGVRAMSPHLAALAARGVTRAGPLARAAYDTVTANGEAVRRIYEALPAAKAQRVISHLEMAKRRAENALRMGVRARPATAYARAQEADRQTKLLLQTNLGLPKGLALKPEERDAIRGAVRRYIVGPPRTPRSELAKALVGGDSTIQRLVELTNLPMFAFPFRHMANIASLAGIRDPKGLAETLARKVGQNISPKLRAENEALIRDFQQRGLQGFSSYRTLPSGFQGAAQTLATRFPALAKPIHGMQNILNKEYGWSQNTLWNWDDLARATLIKREMARGTPAEEAAHGVNRALVDYGVTSPLTQSMYDIAPFATFRHGIPGAVLRSISQHPERAQIMDRLTGGTFTGGTGSNGIDRMYLPPADVGRGVLGDPLGFLRGTLSWPVQDSLSLMGDISAAALHGEPAKARAAKEFGHYFTYGKPVIYYDKKTKHLKSMLPSQLIRVPFSDEMFQQLSPFKAKGWARDFLQSQFGVEPGQ